MRRSMVGSSLALLLLVGSGCPSSEPPAESASPQPDGTGRVVSFDGVPIAYTVSGNGEGALVFIHGWCCDQTFWQAQVDAFSRDQTVVTVDLAGHGLSGHDREDWSFDGLGRDVQAVVEALDLHNVVLVGHSMGGPVALAAARAMPGRVLAVIGVDTLQNAEFRYAPEQWATLIDSYRQDFRGSCAAFSHSMFPEGAEAGLVASVTDRMCDCEPRIGIALFEQFADYDMGAALREAGVPVRVINAATFPTEVEINRKYAPDFNALTMDGVGHFLHMERPEAFNALLQQWIEELTVATSVQI